MTRTKKLSLTDPALVQAIDEQHTLFIERFGREPTPDDPLFFCWHSTTPVPMCEICIAEYEHGVVEAATEAGVDPARALEAAGIDDRFGTLKARN
jgi:hypothetical protein